MADTAAVMQSCSAPIEKTASPRTFVPEGKYVAGQENVDLNDFFGNGASFEKVAEAEGLSSAEVATKTKEFIDLNRQVQNLSSDKESLGDQFVEKLAALKLACAEPRNAGNTGTVVGAAIESANPSAPLLEIISADLGDSVFFGGLEKVASMGMTIMGDNQITGLTQDVEQVSQKLTGTQDAIDSANMAMRNLLTVLRGPDPGGSANQIFAGRSASTMPAPQPASPSVESPQPTAPAGPSPAGPGGA